MECSRLSKSSLVVSALGLGCMGMSDFYAGRDDKEAIFWRSQVIVATEFGNVRITETAPQGVASGQRYGNTPMPRTNH